MYSALSLWWVGCVGLVHSPEQLRDAAVVGVLVADGGLVQPDLGGPATSYDRTAVDCG